MIDPTPDETDYPEPFTKATFNSGKVYRRNINMIEAALQRYPGLYPDKAELAKLGINEVLTIIDHRERAYRGEIVCNQKSLK